MAIYSSLDFLNHFFTTRTAPIFNLKCTALTICTVSKHLCDLINFSYSMAMIFYDLVKGVLYTYRVSYSPVPNIQAII